MLLKTYALFLDAKLKNNSLFELIYNTKRFKDIMLMNYKYVGDEVSQFSAISFIIKLDSVEPFLILSAKLIVSIFSLILSIFYFISIN